MVIPSWPTSGAFLSHIEQQLEKSPLLKMVSHSVMEWLSSPFVWMPLLFVIVSMLYSRFTAVLPPPSDLPWVGKASSTMFAETRAHLASFSNVRQLLHEGYNNVCSGTLIGNYYSHECHSSLVMAKPMCSPTFQESPRSSFQAQRCDGFWSRYVQSLDYNGYPD